MEFEKVRLPNHVVAVIIEEWRMENAITDRRPTVTAAQSQHRIGHQEGQYDHELKMQVQILWRIP